MRHPPKPSRNKLRGEIARLQMEILLQRLAIIELNRRVRSALFERTEAARVSVKGDTVDMPVDRLSPDEIERVKKSIVVRSMRV